MPALYSKLGKAITDLLDAKKWDNDKKFSVTSKASKGVKFESGGQLNDADGGYTMTGHVKVNVATKDIGNVEVKAKTNNAVDVKIENNKLVKGLNVVVSGNQKMTGKVEAQYKHFGMATSLVFDHAKSLISADGVVAVSDFNVGMSANYAMAASKLDSVTATVEYNQPDFTALLKTSSHLDAKSPCDGIKLAYLHKCTAKTQAGAQLDYDIGSGASLLSVASSHELNVDTSLKEKIDSNGLWCWSVEHRLNSPALKFTLNGKANLLDRSVAPKFGFGFALGDY